MKHLATIGFGYTAAALARRLGRSDWRITGTSRTAQKAGAMTDGNITGLIWNESTSDAALIAALRDVTHLLISAAPQQDGDPVIGRLNGIISDMPELSWVGYLSTVGVYGNHDGALVDETTPPQPRSTRGRLRVAAEAAWRKWEEQGRARVHVFRLPGIYGPGRSAFDKLDAGKAKRVIKPGQVFNRMHVDDIAGALEMALDAGCDLPRILNLADDLPAPPQDVIAHAAGLMGIEPPPEVAFDEAEMSAMARSFYSENKRVSNDLMKRELGYRLQYPTYREGLAAIWQQRHASDIG